MNAVNFQTIPVDEIVMNEYETAKRLNVEKGYTSDEIEMCLKRLKNAASCRFSSVRMPYTIEEKRLNCGFGEFENRDRNQRNYGRTYGTENFTHIFVVLKLIEEHGKYEYDNERRQPCA